MITGNEIKVHFAQAKDILVGWDEYIVQAMLAIMTREHVLWIGGPGAGKSYAARIMFNLFSDVHTMRIQLTKDMMPENLIGNQIADEFLKTGKEVYYTDGGLTQVQFFFGDEFEDASDYLIRTLLTIMNERLFERKDVQIVCPLHTGILTTNFDRASKAIEAMKDRILFKAEIPAVSGYVSEVEMYRRYMQYVGEVPALKTIPYAAMKEVADLVERPDGILVPNGVQLATAALVDRYWKALVEKLAKDGQPQPDIISPRTRVKLMDVVRASAFLAGREIADYEDLALLKYVLCKLGADKTAERVFTEQHSQIMPASKAARDRWDQLGALSEAVAALQKPAEGFDEVVLRIGQRVKTYTKIEFEQLLQSLRSSCKKAEIDVLNGIEAEYKNIGVKPDVVTFTW